MDYYRLVFNEDGTVKSMSRFDHEPLPMPLAFVTTDEALYQAGLADLGRLKGTIVDGQVVAVALDPAWQPPAPPPDPLADLAAKVDKLPTGTIHETRLRDQKEFMKLWAIPWVKANPQANPEDAAQAILAALWAEFPADPICIQVYGKDPATGREDGLLMSYAESAHAAGLTPDPSWQALRGLIVQAPEQQLREALRKL